MSGLGGAVRWVQGAGVRGPKVVDQVASVIGCVCGAVAVLYLPVLFGLAGVVLGVVGHVRGEPLGRWAAIAAGAGMLLGTLLSILLTPR
ncbi:Basic proline-rich protein [[Actinomadura] parvosata subsp. kistnae]|nr:Basic proline-rich protein [Actinomadura parvosata subsp. kistnae]